MSSTRRTLAHLQKLANPALDNVQKLANPALTTAYGTAYGLAYAPTKLTKYGMTSLIQALDENLDIVKDDEEELKEESLSFPLFLVFNFFGLLIPGWILGCTLDSLLLGPLFSYYTGALSYCCAFAFLLMCLRKVSKSAKAHAILDFAVFLSLILMTQSYLMDITNANEQVYYLRYTSWFHAQYFL